jgi:hypothetical protein
MDLIALAATFVLSIGVGLAGSRVLLGAVLSFMMRTVHRNDFAELSALNENDGDTHRLRLARTAT